MDTNKLRNDLRTAYESRGGKRESVLKKFDDLNKPIFHSSNASPNYYQKQLHNMSNEELITHINFCFNWVNKTDQDHLMNAEDAIDACLDYVN